jgi:hypothetical protein
MKTSIETINAQKNRIEGNLEYIKSNIGKMEGPIFVELIGTAKSGKTTLLNNMTALLTKNGVPMQKRAETAEYNPIENKDIEEYNIWMYSELMKNLSEDMSDLTPRVVIYDRGMLDRLPWIDFSVHEGSIPQADSAILKNLFESEFMKRYKPLTYGFITSPETSVLRKGREGRLVNLKSVKLFNDCMAQEDKAISAGSGQYSKIKTDNYQGYLKEFIMDFADRMTSDVRDIIQERIAEKQVDDEIEK